MINFSGERSFAALWKPTEYTSGKVMVLLHGTGGTAYDEIKDELPSARKHGYMLIGLQWLDHEGNRYLPGSTVWRLSDQALHHAGQHWRADVGKAALCGFSRGGAISFEVAWRDAQEHRHFKLVICHSGGIPADAIVSPRGDRRPDSFFTRINSGQLASDGYHGCHFFLYSGDRDEQWGREMSAQMAHAMEVLPRAGAKIAKWVRDEQGGHMGYRRNPDIHASAIQYFEQLTSPTTR